MEDNMDISLFLSKALGLYLLIVGSAMVINSKLRALFLEMLKNTTLLYVSDFIGLIVGILIVTGHNVWTADWRVLITLIGWVILLKGTVRVVFPNLGNTFFIKWIECKKSYYTSAVVMIILGAIVYYNGCIHSQPLFTL
jgi:hypothetical protein